MHYTNNKNLKDTQNQTRSETGSETKQNRTGSYQNRTDENHGC